MAATVEARRTGGGSSDTRERILIAALTAFAERGVAATSLDSVAREVGVRKQTLLYWFPSKERLLLAVIDEAVDELGLLLSSSAVGVGTRRTDRSGRVDRLRAVVDAVFRLGSTRPELLAVVREVIRLGPPASTHLLGSIDPLVDGAAAALGDTIGADRVRRALLAAGARVIGFTTEAEVRTDLGLAPDLAWLRRRRRTLLDGLVDDLADRSGITASAG